MYIYTVALQVYVHVYEAIYTVIEQVYPQSNERSLFEIRVAYYELA